MHKTFQGIATALVATASLSTAVTPAQARNHGGSEKILVTTALRMIEQVQGIEGVERTIALISHKTGVAVEDLAPFAAQAGGVQGIACRITSKVSCLDSSEHEKAMARLGDDTLRRQVVTSAVAAAELAGVNADAVARLSMVNTHLDDCRALTAEDELNGRKMPAEYYEIIAQTLNEARQRAGLSLEEYSVAELSTSYSDR